MSLVWHCGTNPCTMGCASLLVLFSPKASQGLWWLPPLRGSVSVLYASTVPLCLLLPWLPGVLGGERQPLSALCSWRGLGLNGGCAAAGSAPSPTGLAARIVLAVLAVAARLKAKTKRQQKPPGGIACLSGKSLCWGQARQVPAVLGSPGLRLDARAGLSP